MSFAGLGAVVIWHDIAPEGRQAFYAWHCCEHMPERTGIPNPHRPSLLADPHRIR
ncbi:MAG TPA: hypothetical protein VKG21_06155 [Casimicrobiaceae bacterium]|nr:hypothetical protein [Casimicrobiaceae bacterium]